MVGGDLSNMVGRLYLYCKVCMRDLSISTVVLFAGKESGKHQRDKVTAVKVIDHPTHQGFHHETGVHVPCETKVVPLFTSLISCLFNSIVVTSVFKDNP